MATKKTTSTASKKTTASSKSTASKSSATKASARKAPAKKATTAAKAPAKKAPAKKAPAKKAPATKAPATKAPATKAPAAKTDEQPKPRSRKKASKYSVGDKVVHPQHGAATIAKKLKQEFAGEKKDYFVLDIATEQLTVMVPVDTIEEVIRPIISKTQARKVLGVLKEEPQEAGSNWSRWYKVLNEKMTSGDNFQVAEVVRDLNYAQQTKGISPALKRMLSKARVTLTSELEFSLEISDEDAVKRLDRALPKFDPPEE